MKKKEELIAACNAYIEDRIRTAEQALETNRSSLENESKSSAGDKFETTRELIQQDVIRNEILLGEANEMKVTLSKINIAQNYASIQSGALVECDTGVFFFAIGIGKLPINGKDYFILSINSPIGQAFKDKKAGDTIHFNGNKHRIKNVF